LCIDRSSEAEQDEPKRESVALFVREQADGTAESAVRVLTDAVNDINAVGRLVFPDRATITANFHGVLSDHNVTERKTNTLLQSANENSANDVKESVEMFCWNHK
jgi:hypothetical protein